MKTTKTGQQTVTKTVKLFNTLNEIFETCKGHQVTAQEIINRRAYINGEGWQDIEISDEVRQQTAEQISELLGGRHTTRREVKSTLLYGRPQHWGLSRTFLEDYGKGAKWRYCAGQDQTWESAQIRKALK